MSARKFRNSWWTDFRYKGERYRFRSPENSKAGAQAYEAALRQKLARGEKLKKEVHGKESDKRFERFASLWFDRYVRVNNKPSEQRIKESILRMYLLPFFSGRLLAEIKNQDIEAYKAFALKRGVSGKTVNNQLVVLGKLLRSAQEWGLLEIVPRIVRLKVTSQRLDYLSEDECRQILGCPMEPEWRLMILLALRTGMRLGELLGLDWSDINFGLNLLTVRRSIVEGIVGTPKNHRERHIPLTPGLRDDLWKVRKPIGWVFRREDGSALVHWHATTALRRACRQIGLHRIGWHTFRHTFASHLAMKGIPLPVIQSLLGHSSITMTMRYAHLSPTALHSAIARLEEGESVEPNFGQQVGNARLLAPDDRRLASRSISPFIAAISDKTKHPAS